MGLQPAGKIGLFILVTGIAGGGLWTLRKYIAPEGQKAENITGLMASGEGSSESAPGTPGKATPAVHNKCLEVGVVTWGGYAGGQYWNGGFKDNPNSRFRKDGICVNFKLLDDFGASRAAFRSGEMDLMWVTMDAFPTESGTFDGGARFLFQADWSRGGDAIVVKKGITSVAGLAGKSIAVAEGTPSHTFLLWMLDMAGLSILDVNIVKQDSAIVAAASFKSGQVDAAVVWSPADAECVAAVSGSSVLVNTKKAANIIADGFMVMESTYQRRKGELTKLVQGWLKGSAEINGSEQAKNEAVKILVDGFGSSSSPKDCLQAIDNVRLTTYGDNLDFFGLSPAYKGVKGQDLYEKMSIVYGKLHLAEKPLPWARVVDTDFIKSLGLASDKGSAPEAVPTFKAPTQQVISAPAIASKPIKVSFATASSTLDDNAKVLIDMLFVEQAKAFPTSHIRIQGNTDSTGSASNNLRISKERAESVVSYLVTKHSFDRNRFVASGRGSDDPVCHEQTPECFAQNRRTDFEILDK
jgi:NitT/TauT family transport system substrate-binding protein